MTIHWTYSFFRLRKNQLPIHCHPIHQYFLNKFSINKFSMQFFCMFQQFFLIFSLISLEHLYFSYAKPYKKQYNKMLNIKIYPRTCNRFFEKPSDRFKAWASQVYLSDEWKFRSKNYRIPVTYIRFWQVYCLHFPWFHE